MVTKVNQGVCSSQRMDRDKTFVRPYILHEQLVLDPRVPAMLILGRSYAFVPNERTRVRIRT